MKEAPRQMSDCTVMWTAAAFFMVDHDQ